jgi:hypothetical protein
MPLDVTNWCSGDTAQVVAISGTEQTRQGGERPPQTDPTTALLVRARSLLERGWCRKVLARNADGNRVEPTSIRAVAWCMYGAVDAAVGAPVYTHPAFDRLRAAIGGEDIGGFNNRQETVEPILAAFDRAIGRAFGSHR